jgi:glycosyltransferase involved in cell wall biosynthesis
VFPSLYEGFGLPILEAFANGCPVILSDRSCFPEIAADAALYFDPDRPDSLGQTLDLAVGDIAVRNRLREAGFQRVKDFTWAATVEKSACLYRTLAA